MKKKLVFVIFSLAMVSIMSGCSHNPETTPPFPDSISNGSNFNFSTGGNLQFIYGNSFRSDQIECLKQLALLYLPRLTEIFWIPRGQLTVLYEVVSREGPHATQVLQSNRTESGQLKEALVKIELNGFGAVNDDPFTQSWLPGVFIEQMTRILQLELSHNSTIPWFAESTSAATGAVLLREGVTVSLNGLSFFLNDAEWSVPSYLRASQGDGGQSLYQGWVLLTAYDPSIMRKVNERLFSQSGDINEIELRKAILDIIGIDAVLDGIKAAEWLNRVGFREGIDTVPDGYYLSWSVTEEIGWRPNWLIANIVKKDGDGIKNIDSVIYDYRLSDAFSRRVIATGNHEGSPVAFFGFEPEVDDPSVWYLDLDVSVGETDITRRIVVPHLLSDKDNRKAVILINDEQAVSMEDGTLEIYAGETTLVGEISNGVGYFDTGEGNGLNAVTLTVRYSNGKVVTFRNLLSLPHISRQWILTIP